jgi:uncharacterized protein YndB with AHSA1/START domain
MNGTVHEVDGHLVLRFERFVTQPVAKAWRALTEPARLAAWFPAEVHPDLTLGGRHRFGFRCGAGEPVGGVASIDPPNELEFTLGDDLIQVSLAPAPGGSVLTLSDVYDDRSRSARDAAGWHTCLDLLEAHLAGRTPVWSQQERWAELYAFYVEDVRAAQVRATTGVLPQPVQAGAVSLIPAQRIS